MTEHLAIILPAWPLPVCGRRHTAAVAFCDVRHSLARCGTL